MDPLAEKFSPISSYCYVANNPIKLLDIDGRDIVNPYKKGTANYKTTRTVLAALQKSNPDLYKNLHNHKVKINFYLQNPSSGGVMRHGRTSVNSQSKRSNQKLAVKPLGKGDNTIGATFNLETYGNDSKMGIPADSKSISQSEAETFFGNSGYEITGIDIFINPNDSKEKMTETAAHEGGHAAFALENNFANWVWGIIGDPNKEGHDSHNPSGKRADAETNKASSFLNNLTLKDWERIAREFNGQ